MLIVEVRVAQANVAVQPMNEQVQSAEAIREILTFLTEERKLAAVVSEMITLHEHAARTATGVKHLAFRRLQHCHEQLNNARGSKVFTAAFAFGRCELA